LFFHQFHHGVTAWMFLAGTFNIVGLAHSAICLVLSSAAARQIELDVHDMLMVFHDLALAEEAKCPGTPNLLASSSMSSSRFSLGVTFGHHLSLSSWRTSSWRTGQTTTEAAKCIFDNTTYPCYVMSLTNLMRYERLPTHEQALHDGALQVVTLSSYYPCRSYCCFISQEWLSRAHPDGDESSGNPKLKWLKRMGPHLGSNPELIFLWMDIFSIPQMQPRKVPGSEVVEHPDPLTQVYQLSALRALPSYAFIVGRFLPLVRDEEDIASYCRRGWCQAECICALTPKTTQHGEWRNGPLQSALRFHMFGECSYFPVTFNLDTLKNPLDPEETDFTVESDRQNVAEVMAVFINQMDHYEASGSHTWDHTFDIRKRPPWLRQRLVKGDYTGDLTPLTATMFSPCYAQDRRRRSPTPSISPTSRAIPHSAIGFNPSNFSHPSTKLGRSALSPTSFNARSVVDFGFLPDSDAPMSKKSSDASDRILMHL